MEYDYIPILASYSGPTYNQIICIYVYISIYTIVDILHTTLKILSGLAGAVARCHALMEDITDFQVTDVLAAGNADVAVLLGKQD